MNRFSIVICSSDARTDFLPITLHYIRSSFRQLLPRAVYVVGITKKCSIPEATLLRFDGPNTEPWSTRIRYGIEQIEADNVLLITEDILFLPQPSTARHSIADVFSVFANHDLDVLRLDNFPPAIGNKTQIYGLLHEDTIYRVSLQPSFWKKDFLLSCMQPNETIWDFEILASQRSISSTKVASLKSRLIPYEEVITRGKISRVGRRLAAKSGHHHLALPTRSIHEENLIAIRKWIIGVSASLNIPRRLLGY